MKKINIKLIIQLAKNDLRSKYRGSMIGMFWLVVNPLALLIIYSFVFSTVFKARWETLGTDVYANYTIILFPGLIMHQLMMEALQKGGMANEAFSSLTTKMNISHFSLILGTLLASAIPFWIAILIWYAIVVVVYSFSIQGLMLFIITVSIFSIFCIGMAFISMVVGTIIKDWMQLLGMVGMGMLFISPILYPIQNLPEVFQKIIYLNPLSYFVDLVRNGAFVSNLTPSFLSLTPIIIMTFVVLISGFWLMNKLLEFLQE